MAPATGTVALDGALYALGIGPGDEVVVPSRTFIASAGCAVMRGARPVVADVDPVSQNLTAETVRAALTPPHQDHRRRAPGRLAMRHGPPPGAGALWQYASTGELLVFGNEYD